MEGRFGTVGRGYPGPPVPCPRMGFRRCLLILTLVAAACGGGDDDDAAEPETTTTTTTTVEEESTTTTTAEEEPAAVPATAITIELLDPGAEPRQELRLSVEEGNEQTFVLRQEQRIDIDAGGATQSTATASEQEVTYAVDSVSDGEIVAKTTYGSGRVLDDPPVDAQTRQVLEQVFASFQGTQGSTTFDEQGRIIEIQVPDIEVEDPQLQLVLDSLLSGLEGQGTQLAVPFPEEAVGIGGRWRVSASFELAGLPFEMVTEVTLTGVGEGTVDGEMTQTLTIPPGEVTIQGIAAEVVSSDFTGGGTVHWDLASPVVTTTQEINGTLVLRLQGQEVSQTMLQRLDVRPL